MHAKRSTTFGSDYWEEGISSIFWALMLRKLLMIEIFEVQGRRAYLLIE
jgi:hypothetical protein